jgi:hypothetical protein
LGMSRSRLKDARGRKVSRSCQQHPTNLPTKDLTPLQRSRLKDCAYALYKRAEYVEH